MSSRDPHRRSLVASVTRSRQVHVDHAVDHGGDLDVDLAAITMAQPRPRLRPLRAGGLLERSEGATPPPPVRPSQGEAETAPEGARSAPGAHDDASTPQRRRLIGQVVGVLAVIVGVWALLAASNSSFMQNDLGSDLAGMTSERAALIRVLEGVVSRVEAGTEAADGDQGADFGADDGSSGRPPAAPALIGRDQPRAGGRSPSELPASPSAEPIDLDDPDLRAVPSPDGVRGAEPAPASPTIGLGPGASAAAAAPTTTGSTGAGGGSTTEQATSTSSAATPPPTASPTVTTGRATTITTGPTNTEEPTVTTGGATTTSPPSSNCVVIVSRQTKLWDAPGGAGREIGRLDPGAYRVLERFGAKWYRTAGGWVRDTGHVAPESC